MSMAAHARAPARRHGGERRQRDRHRADCRGAGLRLPFAPHIEPAARTGRARLRRTRAAARARSLPCIPTLQRRPISCAPARSLPQRTWTSRASKDGMHDRAVAHREAGRTALLVSFPHTGLSIPAECAAALVSFPLARHDADWHIDKLYAFATELGATTVHTALSRTVIDVNRDPSGASLYPGQTTTGLCPTDNLRRPSALPRRAGTHAGRDRAAQGALFRAVSSRARRGDRTAARPASARGAVRLPLHPFGRCRGCLPANFRYSISAPTGKSCDPALEAAVARRCAASPWSHVVNGRFNGG